MKTQLFAETMLMLPRTPQTHHSKWQQVCRTCRTVTIQPCKECVACGLVKPEAAFTQRMWSNIRKADRICTVCMNRANFGKRRKCHGFCISLRRRDEFSAVEWRNQEDPHCRACVRRHLKHGTPYHCTSCRNWFAEESFFPSAAKDNPGQRICKTCRAVTVEMRKKCVACNLDKPEAAFTQREWRPLSKTCRTCKVCMNIVVRMWTCQYRRCKLRKPMSEFSRCRSKYGPAVKGNSRLCNTCVERYEADCAGMARSSKSFSRKRMRTE